MDLLDALEAVAAFFKILFWVLVVIITIRLGGWAIDYITNPSNEQAQCLSLNGAKWSGENCYKNGIKINFSGDNLL